MPLMLRTIVFDWHNSWFVLYSAGSISKDGIVLQGMRRLHPRGAGARGIVVDAEGVMLGPDCVLVRRSGNRYRCIDRDEAAALQALVLDPCDDPDWLFQQSCSIAKALTDREVALAQIFGLRIPVGNLDNRRLTGLAAAARLVKANFNPDEPRDDHGRWTDADGGGLDADTRERGQLRRRPGEFVGRRRQRARFAISRVRLDRARCVGSAPATCERDHFRTRLAPCRRPRGC